PSNAAANATPIMTRPEMIRTRSSFKLLPSATEAALAASIMFERLRECPLVEVRPHQVEEQQLRVSSLPQKEIGEANLARRTNQEVELGQIMRLQVGSNGRLINRVGIDFTSRALLGQATSGGSDLGPRTIVKRDHEGQLLIVPRPLDSALELLDHFRPESRIITDEH